MRLPRAEHAQVDDSKLADYVLNLGHPVGGHHARLFDLLLGITVKNRQVLREALGAAVRDVDVTPGRPSQFGVKYEMRFPMRGPGGEKTVLAVWLMEPSANGPRLITCYVE